MSQMIGRDVKPEIGTRVELDPRRGDRGKGTLVALNGDGRSCAVNWDSGERDNDIPTGDGGQFYLIKSNEFLSGRSPEARPSYASAQHPPFAAPVREPQNAAQPGVQPQPTYGQAPSWQSNQSQPQRRGQGSNGGGMDWLEEASGLLGMAPSTQSQGRPHSRQSKTTSRAANVSRSNTTVGMSVYGTTVDLVVPGGPAQLSQQLEKNDEILEVDGRPITQDTLTPAIVGGDVVNSTVSLTVRKARGGQVVQVELMRVPKASIESMVELFALLTKLKQNGHNNEDFERDNYPPEEEMTVELVDRVVALLSTDQIERYNADLRQRKQFQDLYGELRQHLSTAYADIDQLERQKSALRAPPEDADRIAKLSADLDRTSAELVATGRDLAEAREQLEKARAASESAGQRGFEIQRLQAQSDLLVEELEAAQRALTAKDQELQRRAAEDADLEQKMQTLQGHLDAAAADDGQLEALQREFAERERAMADEGRGQRAEADEALRSARADLEIARAELARAEEEGRRRAEEAEGLRAEVRGAGGEMEALKRALTDATRQLEEDKQEMRRLAERAKMAGFRQGDVAEVEVKKAAGLPAAGGRESDVREVFVVLNVDGRKQVQQTTKQMGRDIMFEERFVAALEPSSRVLNAAVYTNEPGKPAELLGSGEVQLEKVKWGPAEPVLLHLHDDEHKPLFEHSGVAGGHAARPATLELAVGKANVAPEKMKSAERDLEELRVIRDELEAARDCIRGLEAQLDEARQQLRMAKAEAETVEAQRKDARRIEGDMSGMQKRLSAREVQVQELESTVAIKDQLVQDLQKSVVAVQKERQLQALSHEEALQALRSELSGEQGARQEVKEVKQERDLLMQRIKALTEELVSAQDGVDSLQGKLKAKEGAGDVQRENETLRQKLKVQDELVAEARKVEQKNKKLHEELAAERAKKTEALAGQVTAKEYQAEMLKMQVQLDQVQVQYDDLMKQFQQTRRKDKQEADAEAARLQARIRELEARPLPPDEPEDAPRRQVTRDAALVQRAAAPPPPPNPAPQEMGVIGLKIENNPPHHVMSVTELMDEFGRLVNDRVRVGHELIAIEGTPVKDLPVGDVIQRVSGPAGTVVTLRFLDEVANNVYDVKALRHVPLGLSPQPRPGTGSAGPQFQVPYPRGPLAGSSGPQMQSLPSGRGGTGTSAGPQYGGVPGAWTPPNAAPAPPAPALMNRDASSLASIPARSPPLPPGGANPLSNRPSPPSPGEGRAELV